MKRRSFLAGILATIFGGPTVAKEVLKPGVYIGPKVELSPILYKGVQALDAGFFYCPYVPLQMGKNNEKKAINTNFKTRYGVIDESKRPSDGFERSKPRPYLTANCEPGLYFSQSPRQPFPRNAVRS